MPYLPDQNRLATQIMPSRGMAPKGLGSAMMPPQPGEPPIINEADLMAQMQGMSPPQMPGAKPTIGQYIAQMSAMDPNMAQARQAPPPPAMAEQIPGISSLLQMIMGKAPPDPATDQRLGQQAGNMLLNNQRHRTALDDFQRERDRNRMMGY